MHCIQEHNPLAGFQNSHTIFCLYCEEEATHHFNIEYACGNVCLGCAKKRFQPDQVEEGTYNSASGGPEGARSYSTQQEHVSPTTTDKNVSKGISMTEADLKAHFEAALLAQISPEARDFIVADPYIWLLCFWCFTAGWEASNDRYVKLVEQTTKELGGT